MAFVKFSRGLLSTYNNLSRKDPDTLYLVYESVDSRDGRLYLGEKLISDVGNSTSISLNDLSDVSISGLQDGMILQYNAHTAGQVGDSARWEAVSIEDALGNAQSARDTLSIVDALEEISKAKEKDIAIVGEDVYIYHDNDWVQLSNSLLADEIESIKTEVGHAADVENDIPATGLYKEIADLKANVYTKEEILEQIADLSHLSYRKVNSIEDVDPSADEAATTIYLIPKNSDDTIDGYDEYFVVDGVLEKIGSWDISVDDILTTEQLQKIDAITLDSNNQMVIQSSQVGGLVEAIQSNQLIKDVDAGTFEVQNGKLFLKSIPSIDLTGYVKTEVFDAAVGDLNNLTAPRAKENSTIVDEINYIKESILWQELINA